LTKYHGNGVSILSQSSHSVEVVETRLFFSIKRSRDEIEEDAGDENTFLKEDDFFSRLDNSGIILPSCVEGKFRKVLLCTRKFNKTDEIQMMMTYSIQQ
jgi:hypothetical protein